MINRSYIQAVTILENLCMTCSSCKHDTKTKICRHFKRLREEVHEACGYIELDHSNHTVELDKTVFEFNDAPVWDIEDGDYLKGLWCNKYHAK